MAAAETYDFGPFSLEVGERRLRRSGRPVPLEPRTFDLLVVLVRHSGRLLTKRELLDLVWRDAFVEDGVLSVHVAHLRKALDDGQTRSCIETVPRAGYRFVSGVQRRNGAVDPTSARGSSSALVHELVGRGRQDLLAASMECVPRAVSAFREAVALDPSHAAAHAGLALACCATVEWRLARPTEAYAEAKSAALRALAMDADSADAQVALGTILFLSDWQWAAARRSLERALELNPDHTEAYLVYGRLLEALGQIERGPASPLVHLQIAGSYWNLRKFDEMIVWTKKALERDPRHPHAREFLAAAYLRLGDFDRHFAENLDHARRHGVTEEVLEPLKRAYAEHGRRGVVLYVLDQAAAQPSASAAMLAVHHAEIGEFDEAFAQLDRAIDLRDPALVHLAVAPQWDPLRSDPRFAARLVRMGLINA